MDKMVSIEAKPESIQIDPKKTAIVVVDMQNAFVSKGGMIDLMGRDLLQVRSTVPVCQKVIEKARKKGCRIVYLQHTYAEDLSDSGGTHSPNWYKELSLTFFRKHPEHKEACLIKGTWGHALIPELIPQKESILIEKQRFSGFAGTNLDLILRSNDIKYLIFVGTVANICVESTLRDAFFHNYFPVLISDAVGKAGPDYVYDATIHNVELVFGWVTDSETFCQCLEGAKSSLE